MLERLIHLLMCTQGNCVHRLWWPPSPQGVISESKYIFRAVLEEDRRQPGEAGRGGDGRKSQDEENCTVKQTGFGFDTFPYLKGTEDTARFRHEAFPHLRHGNMPFVPKTEKKN